MSRILVVDDELRVRDLIKKYAKFEGYEISEASNGLQALELCRDQNFDIVIMDVMMPELAVSAGGAIVRHQHETIGNGFEFVL